MTDIVLKYSLLDKSGRKEVNDFLDFLLQKQREKKGNSLSAYKKKILGVTTWSDSDIDSFRVNQELFNSSWKPEKW
ncbi:hypothetical protein [Pleomorphovibrio marinus]|uniref:hypothetical protein n=1 Tax=Pleomorphovibrio marinus TaxID=2164132 RepID=UPI000E09ED38|nr:hypothetical protein [Pleomorphovibrio marinus]